MTLRRRSKEREASTVEYEPLEDGEHEGRLIYVADLGMQHREYKGEVKPDAQQISLGIEILGKHVTIDGEAKPRVLWVKPFNVFHEMSERGKEFQFYRVFDSTAAEGEVADWDSVLNTPCNVVVGKRTSGDRTFDNIEALTPIPTKYQADVDEAELAPCIGDCDDASNVCNLALFGLVKYVFDKRIEEVDANF